MARYLARCQVRLGLANEREHETLVAVPRVMALLRHSPFQRNGYKGELETCRDINRSSSLLRTC